MNKENFDRLITTGEPLAPEEIATDENLSLAALDNQMRAEQDEQDEYTMTADKLAGKIAGMGIASLQLPDGLAQNYDLHAWREEDEEILRAEQEAHRERSRYHWMLCDPRHHCVVLARSERAKHDAGHCEHHRGEHEQPADRGTGRDQGTQGGGDPAGE